MTSERFIFACWCANDVTDKQIISLATQIDPSSCPSNLSDSLISLNSLNSFPFRENSNVKQHQTAGNNKNGRKLKCFGTRNENVSQLMFSSSRVLVEQLWLITFLVFLCFLISDAFIFSMLRMFDPLFSMFLQSIFNFRCRLFVFFTEINSI